MNKDYNDYIIRKPNEFIKELAGLFASLNPERVRESCEKMLKRNQWNGNRSRYSTEDIKIWVEDIISDLCSGSQETTKDIKLGEVFNVDGKKYAIQKPKTSSEETDPHGTITYYLTEI